MNVEDVPEMTCALKLLIKRIWKSTEIHRLLHPTWEASKFLVKQNFKLVLRILMTDGATSESQNI